MKRQDSPVLVVATLAFSWLAMQAVHELGHVAAAWTSGGQVSEVVLHPATISETRLSKNPHPRFVVWMGPVVGILLPVAAAVVARTLGWRGWYVMQFWAGFCLIANGAYLAFGSIAKVGDAGDALRHGSPVWLLWLFGVITIPMGLWMWDGLGPQFGLGPGAKEIDRRLAYGLAILVVAIITLEIYLSS